MKIRKRELRTILHKLEDVRELLDGAAPLAGAKQRAVENAYDITLDVTDLLTKEKK